MSTTFLCGKTVEHPTRMTTCGNLDCFVCHELTHPLIHAVETAALSKAISIESGRYLAYWDGFGKMRVFSTDINNFHWSVPDLDGIERNYSALFTMEK